MAQDSLPARPGAPQWRGGRCSSFATGFGEAPKFPTPHNLRLLLRHRITSYNVCYTKLLRTPTPTRVSRKIAGLDITLEPGGQFELSGETLENLHETCREVHEHLA